MITRKCYFCDKEFTVRYDSDGRKNCSEHKGITTKNHRVLVGVLQRKCCKCRRWENYESFYTKDENKSSLCKRCFNKTSLTYQSNNGWKKKKELIKYKGGCCSVCGYNRNAAAMSFHHRDNTRKEFGLDIRKCSAMNWDKLKTEADKCDLLCHNCHMERHYPQYVLTN